MGGDPPETPAGIPPGAVFCGNMRWHRNEMRPSNAIINAAFPESLIESAKNRDVSLTIMSIPAGTERMIQFDGIRLGQTSGKWRISGATALVNSINMNPDSKHVAWYRKTIDGEVHWFVTEPIGDPVEANLSLPSARTSGEPGEGYRARRKRSSKERGAQGDSSDEGGDEEGGGGGAGAGRRSTGGRGKRQRTGGQSAADLQAALIANGADSNAAAAALAAAAAAVHGAAMGLGLGLPREVATAAAAVAATGGQAACKVAVTPRMREGGFVVLDHVFGAAAGLTVTGSTSAASLALSLKDETDRVVDAVLALSVVPAYDDVATDSSLASAVVLGALGPWMTERGVVPGDSVAVARTLPGTYYIAVTKADAPEALAVAAGAQGGGDAGPAADGGDAGVGSSGRGSGGSDGGSAPGSSPQPQGPGEGHGGAAAEPGAGHLQHRGATASDAAAGAAEASGSAQGDAAVSPSLDLQHADDHPRAGTGPQPEEHAPAGASGKEAVKGTEAAAGSEAAAAKTDDAMTVEQGTAAEQGTGAEREASKEPPSEGPATTAGAPADAMDVDQPASASVQEPQQEPLRPHEAQPEEAVAEPSARPEPRTTRGRASAAAAAAAATAAAIKAASAPEGPALRTRRKTEPLPAPARAAGSKGKGELRPDAVNVGKGKSASTRAESTEPGAPAATDAAAVEAQEPTWQDLFLRTANEAVAAGGGGEPLPKPRHDTAEVVGRLMLAGSCQDVRSCAASATHLVLAQLLAAEQRAAQAAASS